MDISCMKNKMLLTNTNLDLIYNFMYSNNKLAVSCIVSVMVLSFSMKRIRLMLKKVCVAKLSTDPLFILGTN